MAVAHVQTAKSTYHANETTQTTATITFTAGGLAIVTVLGYESGGVTVAPTSVKLDGTTDFSLVLDSGEYASGADHLRITVWCLENISAGSHSATVVFAHVFVSTLFITEASGCASSAAADGAGASASGSSSTPASGSYVASASNDFWLAAVTGPAWTSPATFTAGTGWTIPTPTSGSEETDSNFWLCGAVEYIANPGTTTENGDWTTQSGFNLAAVVAFKAAGGGGGSTQMDWQAHQQPPRNRVEKLSVVTSGSMPGKGKN